MTRSKRISGCCLAAMLWLAGTGVTAADERQAAPQGAAGADVAASAITGSGATSAEAGAADVLRAVETMRTENSEAFRKFREETAHELRRAGDAFEFQRQNLEQAADAAEQKLAAATDRNLGMLNSGFSALGAGGTALGVFAPPPVQTAKPAATIFHREPSSMNANFCNSIMRTISPPF